MPTIHADPVVEIGGAVTETFAVPVADLATLPRRRLDADFHPLGNDHGAPLRVVSLAEHGYVSTKHVPPLGG